MSFEFKTAYLNGLGQVSDSSRHAGICFTEELAFGVNLELIWIPGGSFLMGTAPDEMGHSSDDAEDGHGDLGFRVVCQNVDNPRAEAIP